MTPELADRMREHKSALLAMLRPNPLTGESDDELLDGLAQRGYRLRLDEADRLVMDGVPLDLASAVTDHKAELTRILQIETAIMAEVMGAPFPHSRHLRLAWKYTRPTSTT